jgi:hypothetical protein
MLPIAIPSFVRACVWPMSVCLYANWQRPYCYNQQHTSDSHRQSLSVNGRTHYLSRAVGTNHRIVAAANPSCGCRRITVGKRALSCNADVSTSYTVTFDGDGDDDDDVALDCCGVYNDRRIANANRNAPSDSSFMLHSRYRWPIELSSTTCGGASEASISIFGNNSSSPPSSSSSPSISSSSASSSWW